MKPPMPAIPCKARRSSDGEPCRQYAMHGQEVCWTHGGAAKQNRQAGARRQAESKALKALSREGIVAVDNPLSALQQLAGEVVRLKDYLGGRVEQLEELRYQGIGGEQIRGELQAYGLALDRCIRVLEVSGKLDIDNRLVKIAEDEARLLLTVVAVVAGWIYPANEADGLVETLMLHALASVGSEPDARRLRRLKPPVAVREQLAVVHQRWSDAADVEAIRRRADEAAIGQVERMEAEIQRRVEAEVTRRLAAARAGRAPLALEAGS